MGPCILGPNYLTKWTGNTPSTTVDCAHVWEDTNSPYNVGIGTTAPVAQLDVRGEINAGYNFAANDNPKQHYRINNQVVLSIDGNNNLFAGVNACSSLTGTVFGGNVCLGQNAGKTTSSGTSNVFVGFNAGLSNVAGRDNTYIGQAAGANMDGTGNIFIGQSSGSNPGPFNSDIFIGNLGTPAAGGETGVIRIGATPQTDTYIAGIYGRPVGSTSATVLVDNTGKLGTILSSRRFKEQIRDMGDSTSALMKLRPVTFLYKPEYDKGLRTLQYGLIAEEVAEVYPDMVLYDNDEKPYTVKYQLLAPMLLNEVQKQHRREAEQAELIATQHNELEAQHRQIATQQQEIEGLKLQLQQQNAAFQDRLSRLETLVGTTLRTAAAPAEGGTSEQTR